MDTRKLIRISLAGALAATLAIAAYAGVPRGAASTAASEPGDASSAVAARPASGPSEGITVHGRWVIEVTNPDGSVADRREFENALVGGGHLAALLARSKSVGKWAVVIGVPLTFPFPSVGPCGSLTQPSPLPSPIAVNCIITESASGYPSSNTIFETLTVSSPSEGTNAGKLVLTGTAIARANSSVSAVSTQVSLCDPATAPTSPCVIGGSTVVFGSTIINHFGQGITSTTLASPVSVATDQQIQITVVISFQ